MIVDAFLYFGEVDMLELRVRTLQDTVDVFVPVVCALTHQGDPVDLNVACRQPSQPFLKLNLPYIVRPRPLPRGARSVAGTRWYQFIERQHRAGVWSACEALGVLNDYDTVLVSDVDEIPNPDVIPQVMAPGVVKVFEQRMHSDRLDLLHPKQPWPGTTVSRWADCNPHDHRQTRAVMCETGQTIPNGGWHFSWFGTDDARAEKLRSFSHGEVADRYDPKDGRANGIHSNGEVLEQIRLTEFGRYDWPRPMLNDTFDIPQEWL